MEGSSIPHPDLLAALARDGARAGAILEAAPPDLPVPTCPGWTLRDLHGHLAGVLRFWRTAVERPDLDREEVRALDAQIGLEPAERYRDHLAAAMTVIGSHRPGDPAWNGGRTVGSVGYVARRLAHEMSIHLYDAQLAIGAPEPVEAELASDGLDEFLGTFLVRRRPAGLAPLGGSVHVHCTDVAGEWMVREIAGSAEGSATSTLVTTREHAKGDVAARGTASDLLLAMWHRRDAQGIELLGDAAVFHRLVARISI